MPTRIASPRTSGTSSWGAADLSASDPLRTVVALADPRRRGEALGTRPDPRAVDAALRLAKPNGLLTAVGLGLAADGIEIPEAWRAEFAAEERSLEACRASLRLIREVASDDGLAVAVIKNITAVDHAPRDVDVFVPEEERPALLEALRARGLATVYDDGAELSLGTAGLARIDVYSRLRYLGRDFLSPAYILASRAPVRSLGIEHPSLAPEATLLLNSAHGLFGHGSLTLLDLFDLRGLLDRTSRDACSRRAAGFGWGRTFDLWVQRIEGLARAVLESRDPIPFPNRHGRRFLLQAAKGLDGGPLDPKEQAAFRLSLLWDDLEFLTEGSGAARVLRRSTLATGLANAAGHRIRLLRGDRKAADVGTEGPS